MFPHGEGTFCLIVLNSDILFLFSKFFFITHYLSLLRSSGIQEDSESEPTVPESISSAGPVETASRPSRSIALLSASPTDRKVHR
jgi:hypothetical protein